MPDNERAPRKLRHPGDLSAEITIPQPLAIALMAGRHELVRLMPIEPLDAASVGRLYELIATLIETNQQLRQYAQGIEIERQQLMVSIDQIIGAMTTATNGMWMLRRAVEGMKFDNQSDEDDEQ